MNGIALVTNFGPAPCRPDSNLICVQIDNKMPFYSVKEVLAKAMKTNKNEIRLFLNGVEVSNSTVVGDMDLGGDNIFEASEANISFNEKLWYLSQRSHEIYLLLNTYF